MRGDSRAREPRQEIRLPAPRIAVAAVHEQDRRLAATATRAGASAPRVAVRKAACGELTAGARATIFATRHVRRESPHSARHRPRSPLRSRVPPLRAARGVPRHRARGASGLLVQAGAAVRRSRDARLVIVGLAPGHARRERERAPIHRRLRRHPALRDAARVRLREPAGRRRRRRRARARRLPDHQRGEVPAAAEQAAAGRDRELQQLSRRRPRDAAARRRRSSRSAASRTTRRCARSACKPRDFAFAHGARHALDCRAASRCSTAITAAATTRTRDG